ncbi:MAG: hypothetical protein CBC13_12165 [Planctomycetia bacterium TMED53]|nr:MAG: hypothetical protein CBC13_12165 [Planctomycetia bacterium TMED53]
MLPITPPGSGISQEEHLVAEVQSATQGVWPEILQRGSPDRQSEQQDYSNQITENSSSLMSSE